MARFKLRPLLSLLLLFNYSQMFWAQELISKSQFNSPATTNANANANKNANGQSTRENQWAISRPGENWVVASEISCWEQNGRWEKEQVCYKSKIVTGHRFRHLSRTGLTGIELKCTEQHEPDQSQSQSDHILRIDFEDQVDKNLPRGKWENWKNGSRSVFAEGFSFSRGEMSLRRSVKNYDLIYHSGNQRQSAVDLNLDLDSDFVVRKCPEDHAICGVTAMMDKAGLGILTAIGLKCCHHCFPMEKWETIYQYDNRNYLKVEKEIKTTVGLQRSLKESADYDEIPLNFVHQGFSARFGKCGSKSKSTGFDWAGTSYSFWMTTTPITQTYSCEARNSCVLKQLVGQCGSIRVPVRKFCKVSVRIGSSIPDSCNFQNALETRPITSCLDALEKLPPPRSKKQMIYPHGNSTSLEVLCDFETDGGGWTFIQRKSKGFKHAFNLPWDEYEVLMGTLDGNFWLGLKNIHALTQNGDQELRIDLEDFEGEERWAKYSCFSISDASDFYRLSLSGFYENSTAGDSMTNPAYGIEHLNNGMRFSTKDTYEDRLRWNCIFDFGGGGWWYNDCGKSSLNGAYFEKGETIPKYRGILWYSWTGWNTSLAKAEMKIRTRRTP